ncbi:MAG TPA: glycosyltransferase [Caulobacteraceae bacterium]|jgi:hopene-associated glycosyltransferase HpnB|nr:glycosyltransferase [Caulobacteraceae bacterium]
MSPILWSTIGLGVLAVLAWAYLMFLRGGFWLMRERDDRAEPAAPKAWPSVVAVVPARNEADVIATSIGSLVGQDYPGAFRIILVDDNSDDGTAAAAPSAPGRLEVLRGGPLAPGWTGKLWAMKQGVDHATADAPDYVLFTDADIAHAPENLTRLVARAEHGKLALTSLMAELTVQTWAERLMIPAFVFFFDMLYPFGWANDPGRSLAAAAGGCMLVRREALERAGGVAAIRGEIIDDCALARALKREGPIWLGLTHRAHSLRPYRDLAAVGRMISRSAYAQLGYSPAVLAGTVAGMAVVYLAAPCLALFAHGAARALGLIAWIAMAAAFQPMLRFYRRHPAWGAALPAIGALYTLFTLKSALDSWRGRGGMWKGRSQAAVGANS